MSASLSPPLAVWDCLAPEHRAQIDDDFARIDFERVRDGLTRTGNKLARLGRWPLRTGATCSLLARVVDDVVCVRLEADAEGTNAVDWPRPKWDLEYFLLHCRLPFRLEARFFEFVRELAALLGRPIPAGVFPSITRDEDCAVALLSHGALWAELLDLTGDSLATIKGVTPTASLALSSRDGLDWLELGCTHREAPEVRAAIARALDCVADVAPGHGICPPAAWVERAQQASLGAFVTQSAAAISLGVVIDDGGFATTFARGPLGPLPVRLDLRCSRVHRNPGGVTTPLELAAVVPALFGVPLPPAVAEQRAFGFIQVGEARRPCRRYELGPWVVQERTSSSRDGLRFRQRVEFQVQQVIRGPFALFFNLEWLPSGFGEGTLLLVGAPEVTLEVEHRLGALFAAGGWTQLSEPGRVALGL